MNILITTLVTSDDYIGMAELMDYNIKTRFGSKYTFRPMITQNVHIRDYQPIHKFDYDIIPYIEFNKKDDSDVSDDDKYLTRYKSTINKFWLFNYIEYDYIVFIDVDSFIISEIDDYIDRMIEKYPESNFIGRYRDGDIHNINSGFFITQPNPAIYFIVLNEFKFRPSDDEFIFYTLFSESISEKMNQDVLSVSSYVCHTGGPGKLLLMFPTVVRDLMLADNETYLKAIECWLTYRASHMMLNHTSEDKIFDYWWKL